jgi:cation diffusion facilitator family transporter
MPSIPSQIVRSETFAARLSIGVSFTLMALKFTAYGLTGSTAVFSDALESIVNVLASCFALYAIHLAHAPADRQHPYGHGKVEFIAAGFEGGMILAASAVIAIEACRALYRGPEVQKVDVGVVLILVAMIVNGWTGLWLIRNGRRHGSITLEADGKHLLSDAVTSAAVFIALLTVRLTGWTYADPLTALGVAIYLIYISVELIRKSLAGLMDEQDLADDERIRQILDSHVGTTGIEPRICTYHKLRHRHSGRYHWVDFHISLPGTLSIQHGHDAASVIEHEIEQLLGEGNATAHIEPCDAEKCSSCPSTE